MISIQEWHLIPYQSWGPINLQEEIETWDLSDLLGDPIREERGSSEDEIRLIFDVVEGELIAVFTSGMRFSFFLLPKDFVLGLDGTSGLSSVPSNKLKFASSLKPFDSQYHTNDLHYGDQEIAPTFGVGLDTSSERICLYTSDWKKTLQSHREGEERHQGKVSKVAFQREWNRIKSKLPADWVQSFQWELAKGKLNPKVISRFGGLPLLKEGEEWPCCSCCQKPMALILQIDSSTLPKTAKIWNSLGVLQLFHCLKDECIELMGESDDEDRFAYLCRIVEANELCEPQSKSRGKTPLLSIKSIVGWKTQPDGPNFVDLRDLKIPEIRDFVDNLEFYEAYIEKFPSDEEKMGGQPHWLQDAVSPKCEHCGASERKRMHFILQLDSGLDSENEFVFGDRGRAYLFQCPKNSAHFTLTMQTT